MAARMQINVVFFILTSRNHIIPFLSDTVFFSFSYGIIVFFSRLVNFRSEKAACVQQQRNPIFLADTLALMV